MYVDQESMTGLSHSALHTDILPSTLLFFVRLSVQPILPSTLFSLAGSAG